MQMAITVKFHARNHEISFYSDPHVTWFEFLLATVWVIFI